MMTAGALNQGLYLQRVRLARACIYRSCLKPPDDSTYEVNGLVVSCDCGLIVRQRNVGMHGSHFPSIITLLRSPKIRGKGFISRACTSLVSCCYGLSCWVRILKIQENLSADINQNLKIFAAISCDRRLVCGIGFLNRLLF